MPETSTTGAEPTLSRMVDAESEQLLPDEMLSEAGAATHCANTCVDGSSAVTAVVKTARCKTVEPNHPFFCVPLFHPLKVEPANDIFMWTVRN